MRQTRSFCSSLIQGLDGGKPAMLPPRVLRAEDHKFGLTLPTVAPSPNRRRSVSPAPPCIAFQRMEVRTGRFSEGIFATSEDVYLSGSTAFWRRVRRSNRNAVKPTAYRKARMTRGTL